jgi:hypothetical protein
MNLVVVVNDDPELAAALQNPVPVGFRLAINQANHTYWDTLRQTLRAIPEGDLIVNLANDLLPGRSWLERALAAYTRTFGKGEGIIGFNDGVHSGETAAHFVAHRDLLKQFYGNDYFPQHYQHNFGDTELILRAQAQQKFGVAIFAILYHNHPATGRQPTDYVYQTGFASWRQDQETFVQRKAAGWP